MISFRRSNNLQSTFLPRSRKFQSFNRVLYSRDTICAINLLGESRYQAAACQPITRNLFVRKIDAMISFQGREALVSCSFSPKTGENWQTTIDNRERERERERILYSDTRRRKVASSIFGNTILSGSLLNDIRKWHVKCSFHGGTTIRLLIYFNRHVRVHPCLKVEKQSP